jgi:hypothetical protein
MRYLSPSQYATWPVYAQQIVFAYSSVPHETLGIISPFEMNFEGPPQSPFGPPDPALLRHDPANTHSAPIDTISPASFAEALRISVQAFHAMVATHKTFMAKTTEERINKHAFLTNSICTTE